MSITSLVGGDFVLAWEGDTSNYSQEVIGARRFKLDGTPMGELVEIANNSDGSKSIHPAVDEWHPEADYVVTWAKAAPGRSDFDILIRAEPFSTVVQGDFLVSTYTTGNQLHPSLAVGADSSFVVVWKSEGSPGSDADGLSVQARWFSPGGSAQEQFQVNHLTTGDQDVPEVAMADDGHFLVVWHGPSDGPDLDLSIQGRLYGPDAAPLGPDFQINSETAGAQTDPVVVHRNDGSFLVVWRSTPGVWGRIVDASGRPMGREQRLNSTMEGGYGDPNVASNGIGSFVVTWVANADSYYTGRRARLFREQLFKDGFESGDTSNWSEVVP